jgi:hypothetical protein
MTTHRPLPPPPRLDLSKLDERQRQVLQWRNEGKTWGAIGGQLNVTPSRASQIYAEAWRKVARRRLPDEPLTLESPVTIFDFSVRTGNCLKNEGIVTLNDLLMRSEAELLRMPNFGRRSMGEVNEALAQHGFKLRPHNHPAWTPPAPPVPPPPAPQQTIWDMVSVENDVPIPPPRFGNSNCGQPSVYRSFLEVLNKLECGQCMTFAALAAHKKLTQTLRSSLAKCQKLSGKHFITRIDATTRDIRVWRDK